MVTHPVRSLTGHLCSENCEIPGRTLKMVLTFRFQTAAQSTSIALAVLFLRNLVTEIHSTNVTFNDPAEILS